MGEAQNVKNQRLGDFCFVLRILGREGALAVLDTQSRTGVAEDFYRLIELLDLERLFQNRYRTNLENPVENFAIRIACDDDHVEVGINLFGGPINLVTWRIGELKVQEHQIEFLLLEVGYRILGCPDDHAAKPDFLQKIPEQLL